MQSAKLSSLWLYRTLAKVPALRRSYQFKIMLVAFLGTHVPLLTLLAFFILSNPLPLAQATGILLIALLATLVGTVLTLLALHFLLAPVSVTSTALQDYLKSNTVPYLPTGFRDAVGILMANTGITLRKLDRLIRQMANYDELTGLPNATNLRTQLQQLLAVARLRQRCVVVLALGLEGIPDISTTWGSEARDRLIREVAQRLSLPLQETDLLAHTAPDLFNVVRADLYSDEGIALLAQALIACFDQPFLIGSHPAYVGVNVGISLFPNDGQTPEQLLQNAEAALQHARQEGRNQKRFFSPELRQLSQERLSLEGDLRQAIEQGQLLLHYQPRIDLETGRILAAEALIRWQHPQLGMVSPARFIPIAEETGLILPIGEWVLRTACEQCRVWKQAGLPPIRIAVNVSAVQLEQQSLTDLLAQVLQDTGLTPEQVEIELTESILMGDMQRAVQVLQQLRQRGSTIALDDFGTGYSSLSYLSRLPFDTLKIDQSFTRALTTQAEVAVIVKAIVAMAKSLGLRITAEGVETVEHLHFLSQLGCHEAQGYFISRPVSAASMTHFLENPPLALKNLQTT
ncbi:EAL domain-containing protein [Synechococcus sp. Nb3U1]|uniref:putative bifunctional diguanylate cyclase/phosphodiesterase n=1 Tax=Synechococcus sp. Nb3U1 TaxID=1914529 RepID=UPI001F3E43DB|nr:EAL domain-containing protein [Synechococcus sp. Nb3U1]MCF2970860.1 EAL domain-containing protein [Synechococcus sp. Nb3U1]